MNPTGSRILWLFLVPLLCQPHTSGGASEAAPKPELKQDIKLTWWTVARFGMFIHWGLYAEDGCFWKGQDGKSEHMMRHLQIPIAEYEKLAPDFYPVKFNAD